MILSNYQFAFYSISSFYPLLSPGYVGFLTVMLSTTFAVASYSYPGNATFVTRSVRLDIVDAMLLRLMIHLPSVPVVQVVTTPSLHATFTTAPGKGVPLRSWMVMVTAAFHLPPLAFVEVALNAATLIFPLTTGLPTVTVMLAAGLLTVRIGGDGAERVIPICYAGRIPEHGPPIRTIRVYTD